MCKSMRRGTLLRPGLVDGTLGQSLQFHNEIGDQFEVHELSCGQFP